MLACARGKTGGESFRIGYVAGLSFWLASLYWLLLMPVAGFPILGWFALSAYLALYPAVWVWLSPEKSAKADLERGEICWSLAGAAVWVALEMIRARLFGGFPWNFLGASQYQMIPLIQIASVTGVYGVSFLVVWVSLSLYSAVRMIFRRPAIAPRLAGGNFPAADRRHHFVRLQLCANGRGKSANFNSARHADPAQRPANFDLG